MSGNCETHNYYFLLCNMASVVAPGDTLGSCEQYLVGCGTYERDGVVRSSLFGKVVIDSNESGKSRVNVVSFKTQATDYVANVGDKVLCRVINSNFNQVYVEILSVGDAVLPIVGSGVIRREDISEKDVDKIIIHEHFKSGDIVRASVISLGDSKQYYLSTASASLGLQMRPTC